ncbi:type IV pilus assembly protein PilZ [Neisseria sp. HSC-16F19]|nr:PilZ domain-containing protein [Neisseria sp. HSC-16F19]MCP2040207.1 type IV pilus assembly protein PilZ [Neisseria sp. HSC-16F19]
MNMPDLPGKMINLTIPDKPELYRSYLSFLQHGGLFVPSNDSFTMGDEVLLIANLPGFQEPKYLRTKVAWINHAATTSGQPQGVGLAFGDDQVAIEVKEAVEDLLPGLKLSDRPTYTL